MPITNLILTRLTQPPFAVTINRLDRDHELPGLAAPGAGIHRQRATHAAGNTGQKLTADQTVLGHITRKLGAGHTGLGAQRLRIEHAQCIHTAEGRDDRTRETAVAHQQVAAQPEPQQRFIARQRGEKIRQIVEIGRRIELPRRTAHAPAGMPRQRFVMQQSATQAG